MDGTSGSEAKKEVVRKVLFCEGDLPIASTI